LPFWVADGALDPLRPHDDAGERQPGDRARDGVAMNAAVGEAKSRPSMTAINITTCRLSGDFSKGQGPSQNHPIRY
jgi:hypothetical protein